MAEKSRGVGKKIFGILFIIVVIATIYFTFFFTRKCKDESCFNDGLKGCKRINYVANDKNVIWRYTIRGSPFFGVAKNTCKVEVEVIQAKSGIKEVEDLVNKKMTCYMPLGLVTKPENDISRCQGLLKEEMQTMIINKLHQYIINNLGEIDQEVTTAV